jgi:hypothetical protein
MRQLNLITLLFSYGVVGFAVYMAASYEMLGYGLHPAICGAIGAFAVVGGLIASSRRIRH